LQLNSPLIAAVLPYRRAVADDHERATIAPDPAAQGLRATAAGRKIADFKK
jgi:hypothetical protein